MKVMDFVFPLMTDGFGLAATAYQSQASFQKKKSLLNNDVMVFSNNGQFCIQRGGRGKKGQKLQSLLNNWPLSIL